MTLIIQNVKEKFLGAFKEVAKNANATIIQSDSSDSNKSEIDFESLRKEMIDDLQKSENYAVFERLRDK